MGISTDVSRLEELQKFSAFFDFISNPKQYVDLVDQVTKSVQSMKDTIEAHTTVQEALGFLARSQSTLEEAQKQLTDAAAKIVEDDLAAATARNEKEKALSQRLALVVAREEAVAEKEAAATEKEAELDAKEVGLQSIQTSLELRQRVLESQEAELAVAKAKVAAFLGA